MAAIPSTAGTIAEILRDNGYSTFAVGKYGLTPDEEATDAGPFDHWPTGKGFDHFFGFLGSQTDQYKPDLVEDQAHVTPDGRHLSDQITDKAIFYIDRQKKVASRQALLSLLRSRRHARTAQVDKYWSDQYKGKFDNGWDAYRAGGLRAPEETRRDSCQCRCFPIATRTLRPGTPVAGREEALCALHGSVCGLSDLHGL